MGAVVTAPAAGRCTHPRPHVTCGSSAPHENGETSTYATATLSGLIASDFGSPGTIVDVGGGQGAMLAAVLHAHPEQRGILFDFPEVVRGAAPIFEAAGVASRCDVVGGDALDTVPAGGDLYLLSRVLPGCDDACATAVLRNCRRAVRGRARLLLVEFVLPDRGAHTWSAQTQRLSDLNMLVLGGGRERTADDFRALLAASGWELTEVTAADAVMSLVAAVAI